MEKINNFNAFEKIFVLVSGGIDSTYLYEQFKKVYKEKVYPVNCFNPYEQNETLKQISMDKNYIQIKPNKKYNYGLILKESFLKLPLARILKKEKRYHKKIFPCCYYIKHKAFLKDKLFQNDKCIVISGIKHGDGTQRRIWLTQMKNGNNPRNQSNGKSTFFHKHLGGQLYCYPFRDFTVRELPNIVIKRLRKKYPTLKHSGCEICPVLVLFNIKKENKRYIKSLNFAKKLGVD